MTIRRSNMEKQVSKSGSKKDACYHKVKARYRVFPSAYASGAIAKCRKVGAANYGKSTKKKAMGGTIEADQPRKRPLPKGFNSPLLVSLSIPTNLYWFTTAINIKRNF